MKRRQSILLIGALAAFALAAAACSKTATNSNNANASANRTGTITSGNTATPPITTPTSPTDVLLMSYDAARNKDVAGFKRTISSSDLKDLEEMFKKSGKNLDEMFKQQLEHPDQPMPETLETRNEKINGDKATVEYKDLKGVWKTTNFVKEGSEWKIKLGDDKAEKSASG